jgi:hypothetical protein
MYTNLRASVRLHGVVLRNGGPEIHHFMACTRTVHSADRLITNGGGPRGNCTCTETEEELGENVELHRQ